MVYDDDGSERFVRARAFKEFQKDSKEFQKEMRGFQQETLISLNTITSELKILNETLREKLH